MNTVDSLSKDITIIMIAHRLNTLKKCDKIIEIKDGHIEKEYNSTEFNKLFENNYNFSNKKST